VITRHARLVSALLLLAAAPEPYPVVAPGRSFSFPADHGAHPNYRTEWWYVTGTVRAENGREFGFQITFFRVRPRLNPANPSAFVERQVIFAHVAVSDGQAKRLLHDSRSARAGFGIAGARLEDGDVAIRDWRLVRLSNGLWRTRVAARGFALDLTMKPTQPPLLQGERGYSRKGPNLADASYYYSVPQMVVRGQIKVGDAAQNVWGKAWLDREWSSNYLDKQGAGWDWTGLNLNDGGALTMFRIRRADGTTLWAGGSYRDAKGSLTALAPSDVTFRTLRRWRSPRTGAVYPVAQSVTVRLPTGIKTLSLTPMFDDQEVDARRSGLPVYWEGAVKAPGATGYLELTGYVAPLRM
jgi:predicted secreted hydrolase